MSQSQHHNSPQSTGTQLLKRKKSNDQDDGDEDDKHDDDDDNDHDHDNNDNNDGDDGDVGDVGDDDDKKELRNLFEQLTSAASKIPLDAEDENMIKQACERYNEYLIETVTKNPSLAMTFNDPNEENERKRTHEHPSLLFTLVSTLHREWSQPAIRFLIDQNPSALGWWERHPFDSPLIHISRHNCHHVLMPWIAKEHTWVLEEYYYCGERSPEARLIEGFRDGTVKESVLRSFLDAFPRIIYYKGACPTDDGMIMWDNYLLLHRVLHGEGQECTADFFKWMVDQNPNALGLHGSEGATVLHAGLMGFSIHRTVNMAEICKYIIDKRPELGQDNSLFELFRMDKIGEPGLFTEVEQAVVTMIVAVYPGPLHFMFYESRDLEGHLIQIRNIFFKNLKLLLNEQKDAKEDVSFWHQVTNNLMDATTVSKKKLYKDLASVFGSWSSLQTQQRESKAQIAIKQCWTEFEKQYHALVAEFDEWSDNESEGEYSSESMES